MVTATFSLGEDYWENFRLEDDDIEFLYNHLLELETPLTSQEMVTALIDERIRKQKRELEKQRTSGGDLYEPKGSYKTKQKLIFPAQNWRRGEVVNVRSGHNPDLGEFDVIQVQFDDKTQREFAANLVEHILNEPPVIIEDLDLFDRQNVMDKYFDDFYAALEEDLETSPDFVRIAGRWFPRALLVDINIGHLNLAEAILDMAGGGPLPTPMLLEQIELDASVNSKLIEFSLDLALQEDPRFDQVGPAGDVLWYLQRLEPPEVLKTPVFLSCQEIDYDRSLMTADMLTVERVIDDEFSPIEVDSPLFDFGEVQLIFPHWRSGTLPLSSRINHLFPTAYEAPRIRFILVDGDSGEKFPGWVVSDQRYVFGLGDWYEERGLMPGSTIQVRKGEVPGEVIVKTDSRRSSREWIRTVLVGSDGGIVYAMLKQVVKAPFDDRMAIAIPDTDALDEIWNRYQKEKPPFERVVVNTVRELAKLNPQSHVHASELYAAINIIRRCPPGPILTLLDLRPWFTHVGDLHYRLSDTEYD